MADRRGEFSFFRFIHVRNDIIIDISVSIRPMITKFGKQAHLEKLPQKVLIKKVLVTSSCKDHVTS